MKKKRCQVCHKLFAEELLHPLELIRPSLFDFITQSGHTISRDEVICKPDLHKFRALHLKSILEEEKGDLSPQELEVIETLRKQEILTENINEQFEEKQTFGEHLADVIASFGGSWSFIISFSLFILIWMSINLSQFYMGSFDPYPFILLNLVLSCAAAFQAPIIMMSQNRQAKKDRIQADHEYAINLKAELQIRLLHSKLDRFMTKEWGRLLEIQELQIDLSEEIADSKKKRT